MARFLISSALPYINGIKHLGNLAGSMLPADVHARFRRLQGHEVLFVCATDEHGTPAELAAADAGLDARQYCDEQHKLQKTIYDKFRLSFDWFGRSSSEQNRQLTQHFCDQLEDAGFIEERLTKQFYSCEDKRFLPDRYVEGICPNCSFHAARGDQCDNCGTLLEPIQLGSPRSKISGSTNIEIRETVHLFLLQSKLQGQIRQWVESRDNWSVLARSIALKWLNEGLQDRAITRDLSWGVPVTRNGVVRPGFENKVFYVWFDAPIEYIASTVEWAEATGENWRRWWLTDHGAKDVNYIQFMGKDNVAFHTVSFPATIIGSGETWKLVDFLKAFNWVTWNGGKFSTSESRGVFMDDAIRLLPSDYWRWKLMVSSPENSDSPFTWNDFRNCVNSDLANVLGNFVNRLMQFTVTKFGGKVPQFTVETEIERELLDTLLVRLDRLTQYHESMEFRKAAAETRAIWALGNEYLQSAAPWTVIKSDPVAAASIVNIGLNLCALISVITAPFMPDAAKAIQSAFATSSAMKWPVGERREILSILTPETEVVVPVQMFQKIEDAELAGWMARFGG